MKRVELWHEMSQWLFIRVLFVLSTTLIFGAQRTDIHVVDSRDGTGHQILA